MSNQNSKKTITELIAQDIQDSFLSSNDLSLVNNERGVRTLLNTPSLPKVEIIKNSRALPMRTSTIKTNDNLPDARHDNMTQRKSSLATGGMSQPGSPLVNRSMPQLELLPSFGIHNPSGSGPSDADEEAEQSVLFHASRSLPTRSQTAAGSTRPHNPVQPSSPIKSSSTLEQSGSTSKRKLQLFVATTSQESSQLRGGIQSVNNSPTSSSTYMNRSIIPSKDLVIGTPQGEVISLPSSPLKAFRSLKQQPSEMPSTASTPQQMPPVSPNQQMPPVSPNQQRSPGTAFPQQRKYSNLVATAMSKTPLPSYSRTSSSDVGFLQSTRSQMLPSNLSLEPYAFSQPMSPLILSTGGSSNRRSRAASLGLIGAGGLPITSERTSQSFMTSEAELLTMASILGMGRRDSPLYTPSDYPSSSLEPSSPSFLSSSASAFLQPRLQQHPNPRGSGALGPATTRQGHNNPLLPAGTKSASVSTSPAISQAGVKLSELLRFASNVGEGATTMEAATRHVIPYTSESQCRYVDILDPSMLKSPPDAYIVHNSHQPFQDLIRVVQVYVESTALGVDNMYVWLDIFCVNLHCSSAEADIKAVSELIEGTRKVLFILDRHGTALSRTWVLYELWRASNSEKHSKLVVLPTCWNWHHLGMPYVTMDLQKSKTKLIWVKAMLLAEFQHALETSSTTPMGRIKEALVEGAKREMYRSDSNAITVSPKKAIESCKAYVCLLYQEGRFSEADEVMNQTKTQTERYGFPSVRDQFTFLFHCALVARGKGSLSAAADMLHSFIGICDDEEMRFEGRSTHVEVLAEMKQFTKAELLCRRLIEDSDSDQILLNPRKRKTLKLAGMIQLACLSITQCLWEEADERATAALRMAAELEGATSLEAATCYYILAQGCIGRRSETTRPKGIKHLRMAISLREKHLGEDHPLVLELRKLQVKVLIEDKELEHAEVVMTDIYTGLMRWYGAHHVHTLSALGDVTDVQRLQKKLKEAEVNEDRILTTGSNLLRICKVDLLKSLSFILAFLDKRHYLLRRSAEFMAKAYVVFKEKFGREADVTKSTKKHMMAAFSKQHRAATEAFGEGAATGSQEKYQLAETLYKMALSLGKILYPEEPHVQLIQGWANALQALGREEDAKDVLKNAGLGRKTMQDALPATYHRWIKPRVAKYMNGRSLEPAKSN